MSRTRGVWRIWLQWSLFPDAVRRWSTETDEFRNQSIWQCKSLKRSRRERCFVEQNGVLRVFFFLVVQFFKFQPLWQKCHVKPCQVNEEPFRLRVDYVVSVLHFKEFLKASTLREVGERVRIKQIHWETEREHPLWTSGDCCARSSSQAVQRSRGAGRR